MKYENKLFLCKKAYSDLEVGKFYKVDTETFYLKNIHLCINDNWFTVEEGDQSFFPSIFSYFCTKKEERKLKLKVIEIDSQLKFLELK